MSIAELLANKRKALKPIVTEEIEEEGEEIEIRPLKVLNYDEIDKKLFLAIYAPYIRDPYKFDWFVFIKYRDFLFPDGAYVLNTFPLLNIDGLLEVYLRYKEPKTLWEYTQLTHILNHMHLNIPKEYEGDIYDLIVS
jgi:hypothetical protein